MTRFKQILKWLGICLVFLFLATVVYRMFYLYNAEKTQEVVDSIHFARLTMNDVMGVNLPPDPGAEADKTVAGIDVNINGIRDDVELAIFKEYPNSAKKRAVSLQYAKALQMEFTQPFLNTEIVVAVIKEVSRASYCTTHIFSRANLGTFIEQTDMIENFVKNLQINTNERKEYRKSFYEFIDSYKSLDDYCDIDYSKLQN
jgi:hypothetical protein